jgi:hypothetical protein
MMAGARMRQLRGMEIVSRGGQIQRIAEDRYSVKSQKTNDQYTVERLSDNWECDCPDYSKRKQACKHVFAVQFLHRLPTLLTTNGDLVRPLETV